MDYLKQWEDKIAKTKYGPDVKKSMCLSPETLEGLKMTGTCTYPCGSENCATSVFSLSHTQSHTLSHAISHTHTVKYFVEMTRTLLSHPKAGDLFILSERLSQDPVENYFGKQRACGGRSDNPTFHQCLQNASSLRLHKSVALNPVRGNCRQKRRLCEDEIIDDSPLPRRKKAKK